MKKHLLTSIFLFLLLLLNNNTISNAENSGENNSIKFSEIENEAMRNKIAEIERQMYVGNLIQYIEFESEVIIPSYIDFRYIEYIFNLASQLEIPTRTAFRLVYKESCFRDTVTSPVGAYGLMQLMPETRRIYSKLLGTDTLGLDRNEEDIYIGLHLLRDLQSYWSERGNSEKYSWKLGLASYNAGKGNVIKYKGVPPFKETQDFITFILKTHSNPEFFANYSRKYEDQIKISS